MNPFQIWIESLRSRKQQDGVKLSAEMLELRDVPAGLDVRSYDGSGNNLTHTDWGASGTDLLRFVPAAYSDGVSSLAGADRPSARAVSNALSDSTGSDAISDRLLSGMVYAWGQFLDHDIGLTPTGGTESLKIQVPSGDPSFDPNGTGTKTINTSRSVFDSATGTSKANPRQQINTISAFIDGSMVYGTDATKAAALRTFRGGLLKTSAGNLLPINDAATFPNGSIAMANDAHVVADNQLFAAGDARANENIELTSLQTLFVREHNRLAATIAAANPKWSDEQIYQLARSMVIAEIQSITYNEWLPALLGTNAIKPYSGYKPNVDSQLSNEFSTAAFRFGHSLLVDDIGFLDNQGRATRDEVSLSQAFFNSTLVKQNGIDPLLKYLASDPASEFDTKVVDSVRNFLFGPPGAGGLDLASLNIERGRDHGLADYNTVRAAYGLPRVADFSQITSNADTRAKLKATYGSVNKIDLWVGILAEDHLRGSSVGPTEKAILVDQFSRLRDGDRFWYQKIFAGKQLKDLESTTLADVIRRNTTDSNLQRNVFFFDSSLSGSVYGDANKNGRRDPSEATIRNWSVQLFDSSGAVVASTTTDAKGQYQFNVADGLRTDDYTVRATESSGAVHQQSVSVTRGDQHYTGVDIAFPATAPKPGHGGSVAFPGFLPAGPFAPDGSGGPTVGPSRHGVSTGVEFRMSRGDSIASAADSQSAPTFAKIPVESQTLGSMIGLKLPESAKVPVLNEMV